MRFELMFIGAMLFIIFGSFAISIAPYVELYVKQGYSRKDAFLMVLKSFWSN